MKEKAEGKRSIRKGDRLGKNSGNSVKKRIQRIVIVLVAASTLLLGGITCILNYNSTVSSLQQSMEEMVTIAADRVEWQITAYKNLVQELGRTARLTSSSYSVQQKQELINEKVESYGCVRGKLIGMDGIAQVDGTDYNDREYFKRASKGETYISEPLIAKADGKISLMVAAPVWAGGVPDTEIEGVVFLVMQPDFLNDIVKAIDISENNGAYIINKNGTTVAHTTEGMVEAQNNTIENARTDSSLEAIAEMEQKMINGENGFGIYRYKGSSKFLAYAPIQGTDGWSLGINAPVSDFMGDTILGIVTTAILMVMSIVIAAYMSMRIGSSIGNPIRECAERLNKVMQGDLQSPVPEVLTGDEISILSESTKGITDGLNSIIGDIAYLLEAMAQGDFTVSSHAQDKYVGDYERILTALQDIKGQLSTALSSIQEASVQVSTGSGQLAENAQALAEGATEQAGAVEELTATIENVSQLAKDSAENSEQAYARVEQEVKQAKAGEASMKELTEAMDQITDTSQEIQNIIITIEDIASQTNLLSLNASIEAARAGEAGKGFAVVAEQIGKLATDSAQSAVDIKNLIVKVLEKIQVGNQITGTASQGFEQITGGMVQFAELVKGTSDSAVQQAQMLEEIAKGVEQISSVVQNNSASAEETSATSEELSAQAENMNHQISKFRFDSI